MTLHDLLNKTCLINLTYTTRSGDILKHTQLAGAVVNVDEAEGISIQLSEAEAYEKMLSNVPAIFHLPPSLIPWTEAAPKHYKSDKYNIDINNPDYIVTWDIVKQKDNTPEGVHEWWEWQPRATPIEY